MSETIGTRGSPLALYQARLVQRLLCEQHQQSEAAFPIQIFTTSGDRLKGSLTELGGKGLFTKELETALIDGDIAMAVHSMKDVPTTHQSGLSLAAILEREDPRDGFISPSVESLDKLPIGACIGTASIRRRAQLSRLRPDITFTLLRGNVGTRLAKLEAGDCDATFLACAGLKRLGQNHVITQAVPTSVMLPAPAQGAIGIETRTDNAPLRALLAPLNHAPTQISVIAERAFLRALDGSCRTPIAALAIPRHDRLHFRGEVLSEDGRIHIMREDEPFCLNIDSAAALGGKLGRSVLAEIGGTPLWTRV